MFLKILVDFWCQFGFILLPQIHQNPPKIDPKRHQNFDRFLLRFFLDFGSVLGAKLEPCWSHVRHILSYSRTRLALFPNSFALFPNSFALFPNSSLVQPYSRTRLALFPNSFGLIPELVCLIPELVLALFPNSFVLFPTRLPYSRLHRVEPAEPSQCRIW